MSVGDRVVPPTSVKQSSAGVGFVQDWLQDKRVRFILTGGANALFAFLVFVSFQHLLTGRWGYVWAVVATHLTTVLVGFASHRRLVFGVRGNVVQDLLRFELVQLSNLAMNALLLALSVEVAHVAPVFAQACIIMLSALCSWFGHSRFSFSRASANSDN